MSDPLLPTSASLQRLVRALSAGPYPAEDAGQEAWLALLKKRLAGGSDLVEWLRGARRRSAREIRRDEARRREREQRAGAREDEGSTLDAIVHLERARALIAAVEALEEPYRTAVVLRYFEDLPPRESARRMGVPVNTARSRVRRGLEGLRRRLDPEALLVLAPFLVPRVRPGRFERFAWPLAASAAVVVLLLGWRVLREPARERSPATSEVARALEVEAADLAPSVLAAGRQPFVTVPAEAAATLSPAAQVAARVARVRGRVVDGGGAPLAGLPLVLEPESVLFGELATSEGITGASATTPGETAQTASGADGSFELRLTPVAAVGYGLWIEHAPFTSLHRELGALKPEEERELGKLVLWRGATLAGRIVTPDGEPCGGPWSVTLAGLDAEGAEFQLGAPLDEAGGFRIERVPPGAATLRAESFLGAELEPLALELADGEERALELVYSGPDLSQRLVVVLSAAWPGAPRLAPEALRLTLDGKVRTPRRLASNRFLFEGLGDRPGTLELVDERCAPLCVEDVRAGTFVPLELVGSAGVRLDLRTRAGAPLEACRIGLRTAQSLGGITWLHEGALPADGLVRGLHPGDFVLSVEARGFGTAEVELAGLAPGEVRALAVELAPPVELAGRVQDVRGTPLAGVEVSCLAPAGRDDSQESPLLRLGAVLSGPGVERYRREVALTRSGPDGAFRFELPMAGTYVLAVLPPSSEYPVAQSVTVTEDGASTGTVLTLPVFQR